MRELKIKGEYITLGQLMKAMDLVQDGAEAKFRIQNGEVSVDGEVETRRGRKLFGGEVISFDGQEVGTKK